VNIGPTPIATRDISKCFSKSYAESRGKFLQAATSLKLKAESHVLSTFYGAMGEELATDVIHYGRKESKSLLILSSGVHGVEGLCGSGCQIAALQDADLLDRIDRARARLLIIHAVNPFGFSHLRRTNENNIDINRNFIDFENPPVNGGYADLHDLLVPDVWPPSQENIAAIQAYIEIHGERKYQQSVTSGQSTHPDGLFYSGLSATWSQTTLRSIIKKHAATASNIAWMDVHTGLGVFGHCEKINAGPVGSHENLALSRSIWGKDVLAPWEGSSAATQARGNTMTTAYSEVPDATTVSIGLEFGTRDLLTVINSLRGASWLYRYPNQGSLEQRQKIQQELLDSFFVDSDEWKGMVWGQCRVALIQAITAFSKIDNLS
jgi:hypothetical protein